MTVPLDARQSLVEIEHALRRRLPEDGGHLAERNVMVGVDQSIVDEGERGRV